MTASPHNLPLLTRRRAVAAMALATAAGLTRGLPGLAAQTPVAANSRPETAFLDAGIVHDIAVRYEQAVYDAMLETYAATGDKEWIEATVEIDGVVYESAGMRLKGNSSLGGLGEGGGGAVPAGQPSGEALAEPPRDVAGAGGALAAEIATAETPERLPWLIQLDRYVDDQSHDGLTELVVRSNPTQTSLNEAVALDLLALAGLASQRAAAVRFTVNGSDPALRLSIEHPNDAWMAAWFSPDGLLYKAEAGGEWTYRGDDPAAYTDSFDLEAGGTGDNAGEMRPLLEFLAFINDSDDATFEAEIDEHLDIDGFATYRAMMELIRNYDDIAGPGNNAYLYVGPDATRFTVVPWDMNLAFGGLGMAITVQDDGSTPPALGDAGVSITVIERSDGPFAGGTPPGLPGDMTTGVMRPGSNTLVERCEALPEFPGLVDAAMARLRADLYESGKATEVLDRWAGLLREHAADLVDDAAIDHDAAAIEEHITRES